MTSTTTASLRRSQNYPQYYHSDPSITAALHGGATTMNTVPTQYQHSDTKVLLPWHHSDHSGTTVDSIATVATQWTVSPQRHHNDHNTAACRTVATAVVLRSLWHSTSTVPPRGLQWHHNNHSTAAVTTVAQKYYHMSTAMTTVLSKCYQSDHSTTRTCSTVIALWSLAIALWSLVTQCHHNEHCTTTVTPR